MLIIFACPKANNIAFRSAWLPVNPSPWPNCIESLGDLLHAFHALVFLERNKSANEDEEPTGNTSNPPADNADRKVNPRDDYCIHASSHRPHTRKSHRLATKRPKPHVQRNTSSTSKPTNWRKEITNQQQTETQKIEQAQQDIEQNKKRLDSQESDVRKLSGGVDSLRQETKQMLQQLQDIKAQQQRRDKVGPAPPMGPWAQTVRA
eukprot:g71534.t1